MHTATKYAEIILPIPIGGYFTYSIPTEMENDIHIGSRAVVPFGRTKYYTGLVVHIHNVAPQGGYSIKPILTLLDDQPIVRRPQLKFWEWISSYYLCTIGEVYKAALPAGLKLESETNIVANIDYEETPDDKLSERERVVLDTLFLSPKTNIATLERTSGLRNLMPTIKKLLQREAIYLSEEVKQNYTPRTESYIKLAITPDKKEELRSLFDQLSGAKKQLTLLMAYLDLSQFMRKGALREVSRKELLARSQLSPAILNALLTKEIMICYKKEVSRFTPNIAQIHPPYPLSTKQEIAKNRIIDSFITHDVTLLHGVTSSGKTEIYMHLIKEVLQRGRQALFLLPEIALTTQLAMRLKRVFGDDLIIYHSKCSDNERVEMWNNILLDKGPKVVLGARSAIFLPFRDLGLVIVDEEHETSYKQQDPAPRYHARNAAIVLASMHGAKTLLGSATPAIESYYNALEGKYGLVELLERHQEATLPEIVTADVKEFRRRKAMPDNFTPPLVEYVSQALNEGEQVILFQNRRGYAPIVNCTMCEWTPKCEHCDVSLTYHKKHNMLTCHYCGFSYTIPSRCPSCNSEAVVTAGYGTQRIEEDVLRYFPQARVARMDTDTTRKRDAFQQLIDSFESQKTNLLIGTQMVSKGLDFDNVSVVGILSADAMMNQPDFRAHERAYSMMAQVAGRAGRRQKQGIVVLQTAQPTHPLIQQVVSNNYSAMYESQIIERKLFCYPPFYRLIYIFLKHRDETVVEQGAKYFANTLRHTFGVRILGPDNPPIARIQSLFIRKIVLKIETQASLHKIHEILLRDQTAFIQQQQWRGITLFYDVDPL